MCYIHTSCLYYSRYSYFCARVDFSWASASLRADRFFIPHGRRRRLLFGVTILLLSANTKRKFRDEDLILDRKIVRCIGSFGLRKIFISAALEFRMKNRRKILQAKVNMKFHDWKLWPSDINKHDPLESCHHSWFIDWKIPDFLWRKDF